MKNHMLDSLYYYYRRARWLAFYPLAQVSSNELVDKPIFIVGHQGNGATIVSRIIRRSHNIVTLSGNSKYFTGADEMQSAMGLLLNYKLTGILHKYPKSNRLGARRGWSYACNELLPFYKYSEWDYDLSVKKSLVTAIKAAVLANKKNSNIPRFLDKSQSYALKIPLIREVLKGHHPSFIGIVRNPLAVCWRAAYLKTGLSKERIATSEKLKIATEHWNNSITCLLEQDGREDFLLLKIEDILSDLQENMESIFRFLDMEFNDRYLPSENDTLPFGTKRRERWYPVKTDINSKYLKELPVRIREYIMKQCGDNMERLGYLG